MKNLCKTCGYNCTDNKRNIANVGRNNVCWCNAEYGRKIKKKKQNCANYIDKEVSEKAPHKH